MAVQLQAMQALALERNIDLSNPVNANMMAQLIPLMHSGMVAQQKANESNPGIRIESVPKQQVNSPQVANENSPRGNSSSDVSGQSGSYKGRQVVSPAPAKREGEIPPSLAVGWGWGWGI
ncbi:ATP-dependent helicase BRM [Abeliophyllum distichum]|uniref:ATP-dependent helicase BRM n=1 Tax=Abeliophyllum distichum TaxID=126358 RepID=A0ABD1P368_9LAMI